MASTTPLKVAIWLYFWLLLFEGALRKWVFPQWSDLLFIIRDPLVLMIYLLALRARMFPWRPAVFIVGVLALCSLMFAATTDASLVVVLFGLRTNYLHLPLVFVMAQVLDRSDVARFGRWTMIASVPIILLMWRQFEASPDDLLNVGVSGTAGAQIRGAMGRIRPSGPFSFVSGVVAFFGLLGAFVFYGWLQRGIFPRLLVGISTAVVAAAVPISISRSVLAALVVVAAFGLLVAIRDIRRVPAFLGPLVASVALLALAADTAYVQTYRVRWEESMEAGSGGFSTNVIGRVLEEFGKPFAVAGDAPLLGHGIGMGTIAGARLTTGQYSFLLSESELARLVLELGPVLGFAFIAWRAWLAALLVWRGWRTFLNERDALAWLLAGASFMSVLSGQLGPSTTLGFAVFGAGLALAAVNPASEADDESEEGDAVDRENDAANIDG